MKYLKNNLKVVISFVVGVILASSITVYAYSYFATDISYIKPGTDTAINVETALNELYNKINKELQQVAILTGQEHSYTFQNDGIILGTANRGNGGMAMIFLDDKELAISNWDQDKNYDVSIYVTSGTKVTTRSGYGTYNLTCYEWK